MVELSVQSKPAVLGDGAPSEGSGRQKHEGEPPGAQAVLGLSSEVEIKSVAITVQKLTKRIITQGSTLSAAQLLVDSKMPHEASKF